MKLRQYLSYVGLSIVISLGLLGCHHQQMVQINGRGMLIELYNGCSNPITLTHNSNVKVVVTFNGDTLNKIDDYYDVDLKGDKTLEPGYYKLECYNAKNGKLIDRYGAHVTNGYFIANVGGLDPNDTIRKAHFSVQRGVIMSHVKPNMRCEVIHYKFQVIRNDSIIFTERVANDPSFTDRIKMMDQELLPQDMILLSEMKCSTGLKVSPINTIDPIVYYIK